MVKATTQGQQGGFEDFTLVAGFKYGYRNREDKTVLPPGVLVEGSQNVLTNTFQRVGIRQGYTLDGQTNADLAPIASSFDWLQSGGNERHMRSGFLTSAGNDGKLQTRYVQDDGTVTWIDILTGLTSVSFNYTEYWSNLRQLSEILFVNGTDMIYEWFGGVTTVASVSNTAGIVASIQTDPNSFPLEDSGGVGYAVNDVLTIVGGNNDATLTVTAVVEGAIKTSNTHIGAQGTSYIAGDIVSVTGGSPVTVAFLTITTVGGSGEVTGYTVFSNGVGYHAGTNYATAGGSGSGFAIDVTATGDAIGEWGFASDADHGSGYTTTVVGSPDATTGGTGTNAKVAINTIAAGSITKTGTSTWAQEGFLVGVRADPLLELTINGVVYTYNSFDVVRGDTTTLYGISPDPSAIPVGSVVIQTPHAYSVTEAGFTDNFTPNLIATIDQRIFLGIAAIPPAILARGVIFVSAVNDFLSYGSGSSGVVGSPFEIFITSPPTALIAQEEFMYISAGHDEWYNVSFSLSADLSTESVSVNRLNTTAQQAAQSQAGTSKIANSIIYLSFEPIIETFGRVENILAQNSPQITDISYTIVNDMNTLNLTGACLAYFRKFVYVAVPAEGLVLMYNMSDPRNPYWEAPQRLPISCFSIIDGDFYGHSSLVSETYKLFDGYNDNGAPIDAIARFSFNNYGTRSSSKGYNEFYVEGYIEASTTLTLGIQYDIDGCATNTYYDIDGDDAQIVCLGGQENSLGKNSLGKVPLGSLLLPPVLPPKFRVIKTFPINYFYEDQISFESNGTDQRWEIICFGPQITTAKDLNNNISQ